MNEYLSREAVLKKLQMQLLDLEADQDKGEYSELCENRGARDALDEAIYNIRTLKTADVQPINRWISCQDKIPEEYKTVLVYEKDYGVMIGELEKKFFDTQYFIARKSGVILRTTGVTHWQPLPEPPVNL